MSTFQGDEPSARSRWKLDAAIAAGLCCAAAWLYLRGLSEEPYFADEGAMYAQSYYWRLYSARLWHHPHWLVYPAFDHPPLSKYLFGISLRVHGLEPPRDLDPWVRWMGGNFYDYDLDRITACRVPVAIAGALGVMLTYLAGRLLQGRFTGLAAALLLAGCPLYYTHARRAMGDILTEAATVATVLLGFILARRTSGRTPPLGTVTLLLVLAVIAALPPLAKLNGAMAPVFVWLGLLACVTGLLTRRIWRWASIATLLGFPLLSFCVFTALNPTLFARPSLQELETDPYARLATWRTEDPGLLERGPVGRAIYLLKFRASVMREGAERFPRDRVRTLTERLRSLWADGFGRFSPLASRVRTTDEQGHDVVSFQAPGIVSWFWGLLVILGVLSFLTAGRERLRNGQAPAEWVLFAYASGVILVLATTLPLRWDRYFLPLQTVATLAGPFGLYRCVRWFWLGIVLPPPPPGTLPEDVPSRAGQ